MRTLGLETIFVGNVRHRVHNAICTSVRELPSDGNRLVFGPCVLELTLLLLRDTIAGLIAGNTKKNVTNVQKMIKFWLTQSCIRQHRCYHCRI